MTGRAILLLVATAILLAPSPAAAAFRSGPAQLEVVTQKRVSERELALTFRTPAVDGPTDVSVLLPAACDAQPDRRWPVVWRLHGAGGSNRDWIDQGDALAITKDFPAIFVLPSSGSGAGYVDWYRTCTPRRGQRPAASSARSALSAAR